MTEKFKTVEEAWADMIYMHVDSTKFFKDWKSPEEFHLLKSENKSLKDENQLLKTVDSIRIKNLKTACDEIKALEKQLEKPVVPPFVANLVEHVVRYNLCPSDIISGFYYNNESKIPENINHADFDVEKISDWLSYAFRRIDFEKACFIGCEVEKEKLFYLKHIDMSNSMKSLDAYISTDDCDELIHTCFKKGELPENDNQKFTQSEIDEMHTGSYEQIPVEEDTENG